MDHLRIRSWDKYQRIAGDRAPYVQVQTDILLDMEFMGLPDRERLCFLLLLCLAGRTQNKLPADPHAIMHLCHFDDVPDTSLMMSRGLIEEWCEDKHRQSIELDEERRKYERRRKRQWRESRKCPENVPPKSRGETETETDIETRSKPSGRTLRFDLWWEAYGKKVKKKSAKVIWRRKRLDDKADLLIEDAKQRHAHDARWKRGFQPDPTTYLRQERWNDEIASDDRRPSPVRETAAARRDREAREAIEAAGFGRG